MAFITAGSQYNGNETLDIIVRPSAKNILPKGMRPIFTDGAGTTKQTFFTDNGMNIATYADGFQGGNASGKKQKTFTLAELKSENQWSKQDYTALVQRQSEDIKRAFQNDIAKRELMETLPTDLNSIIEKQNFTEDQLTLFLAEWSIQQRGIAIGIFNLFWLGDTGAFVNTSEGTGTFPNKVTYAIGDADIRYNAVSCVWTKIITDAATSPTVDQIKKIDMTDSAVAQVDTFTLTGTSGTANLTIMGTAKLATFATSLTVTAAAFVTANAAYCLTKGITLTSSGAGLIFTSTKKGVAFSAPTIANVSGDLSGSNAATTANTVAAAMATDEAITKMILMVAGQTNVMKSIPNSKKVIYATTSWVENYRNSLGAAGADKDTSESNRSAMINGTENLRFNGIRIEEMPIDAALSSHFGGYSPHRAILTLPENLAPVFSSAGEFGESALWWNKDENMTRTRTQFEMGGDYWLPEYMVVAFQDAV